MQIKNYLHLLRITEGNQHYFRETEEKTVFVGKIQSYAAVQPDVHVPRLENGCASVCTPLLWVSVK